MSAAVAASTTVAAKATPTAMRRAIVGPPDPGALGTVMSLSLASTDGRES